MRNLLAHLTLLILIIGYSGFPQSVVLALLLLYSFFAIPFLLNDDGFLSLFSKNKSLILIYGLIFFSYLNTNNSNVSTQSILINIYTWTICSLYFANFIYYSIQEKKNPFLSIVNVITFSSLVNLVVFVNFGNIRSTTPDIDSIIINNLTGLSFIKMNYVFGSLSINHNAVLVALVSPLIFLVKQKQKRTVFLIINGIALLFIGSRVPIIALLLSFILVPLLMKIRLSFVVKLIALIIPLIATIITVLIPRIPEMTGFEFLSRNSEELYTSNSRTLIWDVIIYDISNISFATLFGSGEYGNLAFQSSQSYLEIFQNFTDSEVKTSHNTFFQIILDLGYIYLGFFIFVLSKCMNVLFGNKNNQFAKIFIVSFLIFLLTGTTEVVIGSYYMPTTFVLLMIIFYINNNPIYNTNKYTL